MNNSIKLYNINRKEGTSACDETIGGGGGGDWWPQINRVVNLSDVYSEVDIDCVLIHVLKV